MAMLLIIWAQDCDKKIDIFNLGTRFGINEIENQNIPHGMGFFGRVIKAYYDDSDTEKASMADGALNISLEERLGHQDIPIAIKFIITESKDYTKNGHLKTEVSMMAQAYETTDPKVSPRVLACGVTSEGVSFIAMEHTGDDLFDQIMEHRLYHKLWLEKRLAFFHDLLFTLKTLHKSQIAHCDVKFENMTRAGLEGPIKLIDFGHSKSEGWCSEGTIKYLAPEIAHKPQTGEGYTNRYKADVYSLGLLLWELEGAYRGGVAATNEGIYTGNNDYDYLMKKLKVIEKYRLNGAWGDPLSNDYGSELTVAIIEKLHYVLTKMVAKFPEDRLSSEEAYECVRKLNEIVKGLKSITDEEMLQQKPNIAEGLVQLLKSEGIGSLDSITEAMGYSNWALNLLPKKKEDEVVSFYKPTDQLTLI